ncbi:MAG: LamG domain-containing protein [Parcubacteria group bacterium]|jgi:hypothetical protein
MKYHKGSIVVFALIVLSFILIAAFSVAAVTLVERRSANISVNSTTAFQQADKGMEEFLQQLYKDLEQTDTLSVLTGKLNEIYGAGVYKCVDGPSAEIPAHIGDKNTEFIISAYMENPVVEHDSGWDLRKDVLASDLVPLQHCDAQLADVARFKVAGNYSTAVRAVFVKLRDSLTRGLVAHWSFEDRAINSRLTEDEKAYIAQDSSKNDHVLTLCHPEEDSVKVTLPDGTKMGNVVDFSPECEANSTDFMEPEKDEAWVDGFVVEDAVIGSPYGDDAQEAIYFDGTDYLAMYIDNNCGIDDFNCVDKATENKIDFTDSVTISLWIKQDVASSTGTLVSQYASSDGYKVYLDAGKVCFMVQNKEACSEDAIDNTDWHHIVGRWKSGEEVKIVVDDKQKKGDLSGTSMTVPSEVLYVGTQDHTTGFYMGAIDDLRMWDRSLTDNEVNRLCVDAQSDPKNLKPKCYTP